MDLSSGLSLGFLLTGELFHLTTYLDRKGETGTAGVGESDIYYKDWDGWWLSDMCGMGGYMGAFERRAREGRTESRKQKLQDCDRQG